MRAVHRGLTISAAASSKINRNLLNGRFKNTVNAAFNQSVDLRLYSGRCAADLRPRQSRRTVQSTSMQRPIITALLLTVAGAGPAFSQPVAPGGSYYPQTAQPSAV